MKKLFSNTILMAIGMLALYSCSEDRDSNPTITQPTSFVLNTPSVSNGTVDLSKSSAIDLTWSQPTPYTNLNAPVIPTYTVQISATNSFNTAYKADAEDNSSADYISLDETYNVGEASISAESIDKALMQLTGWSEITTPSTADVSIRLKAAVQDAGYKEYNTVYSNVITLKTIPYYMELQAADPQFWWLIGGDICDGTWGSDVGISVIPMQTIDGAEYDAREGLGEIQWIGYLGGNGFKLRGSLTDGWATQWGQGDAFGSYVKNDGGSGNITVPEAGIYKVTLNTSTDVLTVDAYDGDAPVYDGMAISGSFNSWGDEAMSPCHTYSGAENHDWYITYTFAAGDEVKVKQAGSWDFNKGGSFKTLSTGDLYVYGISGGDNLVIPEDATYTIIFNDITGYIRFIKQQ